MAKEIVAQLSGNQAKSGLHSSKVEHSLCFMQRQIEGLIQRHGVAGGVQRRKAFCAKLIVRDLNVSSELDMIKRWRSIAGHFTQCLCYAE